MPQQRSTQLSGLLQHGFTASAAGPKREQKYPLSTKGDIDRNKASLCCVAPTVKQFLHVAADVTVLSVSVGVSSFPAAINTRNVGLLKVKASIALALMS